MVIFLLLSVPLTVIAAAILPGHRVNNGGRPYPGRSYMLVRHAVLPGVFYFVAMYLVWLVFRWAVPYHYTPEGLYLYHVLVDFSLWPVMASLGAFLVVRELRENTYRDRYQVQLLFFGMIFGLLSVTDVIMHDGYWTVYQIVLLPLARSGMVLLVPLVFARSRRGSIALRDQWFWITLPLYSAGWGFVAMWSEWLRPVASAVMTVAMVVLTAALVYGLLASRYSPHSPPASMD